MIVVDASAVVDVLVTADSVDLRQRIRGADPIHAPHLLDVEVLHALRGLAARGSLQVDLAATVRTDFSALTITRHPHDLLMERAWQLRENLTAYDAVYVALAELLDCPLVTTDGRIAGAPGHDASVEVFGPAA